MWTGISKIGATHIVMFSGIMNTTKYGDILSASLVPFIGENYSNGNRLFDNDPKHTSKYIQNFFQKHNINWWRSPAESLDLNPIELVRGSVKTFIHDKLKPRTPPQLKEAIAQPWRKMTRETCTKYVDHL